SALPLIATIIGVFVIAGLLAFIWMRRAGPTQQVASNTAVATGPATASVTSQSMQPSQTAIDVFTNTAPSIITTTTNPTLSTTTAPITETIAKPPKPPPKPDPKPDPQPGPQQTETEEPAPDPEPAPSSLRAYVEGGDSDNNERLVEQAAAALTGTSRLAVRGKGDPALTARLVNILKDHVTIDDSAEVTVDFFGKLERLGMGRKRRIANAVVTKNGHVVFRYQMSGEYRVGDDPAEAFARVLDEVLAR
ncbi:MAG TPA: hypothetical protein VJ276_02795, partial [Thermoanaerobaculia bacterium]|nr:hypothetical protein [Thermoanaerobaculia bacterium]